MSDSFINVIFQAKIAEFPQSVNAVKCRNTLTIGPHVLYILVVMEKGVPNEEEEAYIDAYVSLNPCSEGKGGAMRCGTPSSPAASRLNPCSEGKGGATDYKHKDIWAVMS